jgi:ubiquinone/menaquinone biosynthesis C-methylase UbiE
VTRPTPSRFDAVDDADHRELTDHLDVQAAMPFWRARKSATLELLGVREGMRVLDVGCGTGGDVSAAAALGAEAVGVDASRVMIETARVREPGARFEVADATALPFAAGSFDAVRCERLLQHLPDPATAIAEMVRVTAPGGVVLALEPDWRALVIGDGPLGEDVRRRWAAAIRSPAIGGELEALLAAAGLEDVRSRRDVSELTDRAYAEQQFAISDLARATDAAAPEEVERWLAALDAAPVIARATYFTVWGRRSGAPSA